MPKVFVITDSEGRILGSVRGDPVETESGTIQFRPHPTAHKYQEMELTEDLLSGSPEELHREFERRLRADRS